MQYIHLPLPPLISPRLTPLLPPPSPPLRRNLGSTGPGNIPPGGGTPATVDMLMYNTYSTFYTCIPRHNSAYTCVTFRQIYYSQPNAQSKSVAILEISCFFKLVFNTEMTENEITDVTLDLLNDFHICHEYFGVEVSWVFNVPFQ